MAYKPKEPSDDRVVYLICKKEMMADDFAEHAVNMHPDDVFDLMSDDDIIEGLSDWVN